MGERISTQQAPKESGVIDWENTVLNGSANRIVTALKILGFVDTHKVKVTEEFRRRRLQPHTLPPPLDSVYSILGIERFGEDTGIELGWLSVSDKVHEIHIVCGKRPTYRHDIVEFNPPRRLLERLFYNRGWIETNKNGVYTRFPLGIATWDGHETDLLDYVVSSLETAAKEAQRNRPLLSKLLGKLSGR